MDTPYGVDDATASLPFDSTPADGATLGSDSLCFDLAGLLKDFTTSDGLSDPLSNDAVDYSSIDYLSLEPEIANITRASLPDANCVDSSGPDYSASEDNRSKPPPKIGTRFSKEAVSILRRWLALNAEDPYPNEEEKQILQAQTSLSKTQVETWLANARRRIKKQHINRPRLDSSSSSTSPAGIPQRPGTPAVRNAQSEPTLLQRWYESPPDEEPAAAADIARAVASNKNGDRGLGGSNWFASHQRSGQDFHVLRGNTAVSQSSRSSVSSGQSNESWGFSRRQRQKKANRASRRKSRSNSRHRTLADNQGPNSRGNLTAPSNRFQCTFCTETFGSKHDWQRHENSLHLPRERWLCAPHGTQAFNERSGKMCCAFCGETDPNDVHIKQHNPEHCRERSFSRKDHLKQHLRLVHHATLKDGLIENWKAPPVQVRSRCGFCGLTMDTWEFRVDHLADHFKVGHTMATWRGDWGFDDEVSSMVQNAIPPYLICTERNTPYPFMGSHAPAEYPSHAHGLIQSELSWFLQTYTDPAKCMPDQERIRLEACRIIFAAEATMQDDMGKKPSQSWLRDLITSRADIAHEAKFGPIRSQSESALHVPKLHSKRSLFEDCPLESQLRQYAESAWSSSRKILSDAELQFEACRIISNLNSNPSVHPLTIISSWLITLVGSSTVWLIPFRNRVYGQLLAVEQSTSAVPTAFLSNKHKECGELQSIQNETNDVFPHNAYINPTELLNMEPSYSQPVTSAENSMQNLSAKETDPNTNMSPSRELRSSTNLTSHSHWVTTNHIYMSDANFHWWLSRELGRWVTSTMSPNNPSSHKPSDEEIRHQARCIVYNDDDPWNPTAADNDEWLQRFKSEFSIVDDPLRN